MRLPAARRKSGCIVLVGLMVKPPAEFLRPPGYVLQWRLQRVAVFTEWAPLYRLLKMNRNREIREQSQLQNLKVHLGAVAQGGIERPCSHRGRGRLRVQ